MHLFFYILVILCNRVVFLIITRNSISLNLADANRKRHLVKGSVQPRDVWTDEKGFRYYVKLNEFCQSLRKGGSILVSFLGDIAKKDSLCPVGIKTWRAVNKKLKSNIVTMVRVCRLSFLSLSFMIN